jgi:hypothetical protein
VAEHVVMTDDVVVLVDVQERSLEREQRGAAV